MLIRIRESLNKMDIETDCKYDLVSLYESCKLTEQEKEKLVKMIYTNEDPAKIFNSLNKTYTRQQGSRPSNTSITNICEDFDDFDDLYMSAEDRYELVTRKDVLDSDGFYTEYTWYKDNLTGKNIFIFGDSDFYTPENTTPDYETENDEDAQKWFDSYEGFADDLDELEENANVQKRFKKPIKEDVQEIQTPSDHGMSSLINNLIISEYDAIDMYNSAIASAETEQQFDIIPVLKDIITEEQTHVGQLQTLAKLFDPSAEEVEKGNIEADKQLDTYPLDKSLKEASYSGALAKMNKVAPKSINHTSELYKGYFIIFDRGGDGYNVYNKYGELEDEGYASKEAAKKLVDELVDDDV